MWGDVIQGRACTLGAETGRSDAYSSVLEQHSNYSYGMSAFTRDAAITRRCNTASWLTQAVTYDHTVIIFHFLGIGIGT